MVIGRGIDPHPIAFFYFFQAKNPCESFAHYKYKQEYIMNHERRKFEEF